MRIRLIILFSAAGIIFNPLAARCEDGKMKRHQADAAREPSSPVSDYNAGVAAFRAGAYDSAAAHFEKAVPASSVALQVKAHYNLGNTKYKQSQRSAENDPRHAAGLMRAALDNYRRVLSLDTRHRKAKHNFEYVTRELRKLEDRLKKQPQESSGGNGQQQQKNEEQASQSAQKEQGSDGQHDEDRQARPQQRREKDSGNEQRQRDDGQPRGRGVDDGQQEMSADEARMLLEDARSEERAGLLRDQEHGKVSDAAKDW